MINVAAAAVTSTAVTEMGHFRQFKFMDDLAALDGFNAIAIGADGSEDFPVLHEIQEQLVTVGERNGEAAMRFLKEAGIPFKYERLWRPIYEVWSEIPNFSPADDLYYDVAA